MDGGVALFEAVDDLGALLRGQTLQAYPPVLVGRFGLFLGFCLGLGLALRLLGGLRLRGVWFTFLEAVPAVLVLPLLFLRAEPRLCQGLLDTLSGVGLVGPCCLLLYPSASGGCLYLGPRHLASPASGGNL